MLVPSSSSLLAEHAWSLPAMHIQEANALC